MAFDHAQTFQSIVEQGGKVQIKVMPAIAGLLKHELKYHIQISHKGKMFLREARLSEKLDDILFDLSRP